MSLESNQLTWAVTLAKLQDFILKEIGNICTRFVMQELDRVLEITERSIVVDPFTCTGHLKDAGGTDFMFVFHFNA